MCSQKKVSDNFNFPKKELEKAGDEVDVFLNKHLKTVIKLIDDYLCENVTHSKMYNFTCDVIDEWQLLGKITSTIPYRIGEKEFWASIWAIQTLASESHWSDSIPQHEFPLLLKSLKGENPLPLGYEGKRP